MAAVPKKKSKKSAKNNELSTDWNVDKYCTDYESDEHWQLRRKFMEVHKDKFTEDRLVCLAQTFINMEFMGCKYPADTMRMVAELSAEVAKEFRESRSTRLKRTFVGAAEAAEIRVKGRRGAQAQQITKISDSNKRKNTRVVFKSDDEDETSNVPPAKRMHLNNFFSGLKYGKFVLQLIGGRNCISLSAQRSKVKYQDLFNVKNEGTVDIYLNDILIASAKEANQKASKAEAFKKALEELQENCFTIKPNPLQDTIKIEKKGNEIVCGVIKAPIDEIAGQKLDNSNKGFKMMKMMGWSGGGLGSTKQGREDPVNYLLKNNRYGLGNSVNLDKKYFREVLTNYLNSNDIRQLQFEPSFTKDERACLHEIAASLNLKSAARGSGDNRYLTITKKTITDEQILTEVLIHKNTKFCDKYFVQVPKCKAHEYPDHTQHLDLDN